jgi:hypothetical protein
LTRIKKTVGLALDIATERLNEISLEDIEIDQASQHRIYQDLYEIAQVGDRDALFPNLEEGCPGVPCTGYWVEDTQELVLFAWTHSKTITIVIPPEEWFLRDDITIN